MRTRFCLLLYILGEDSLKFLNNKKKLNTIGKKR